MWSFKDHGKSWEAVYEHEHPPGFRWLHESFGTNWRMLEIQAVIGRIQLRRMRNWNTSRLNNARQIWECARTCVALRVPVVPEDIVHAAYKCYVFVRPDKLKINWDRDRILTEIAAQGVPCFSGSCSEVYLEKAFDNTRWRPEKRLAAAKELGETSLMFMVHPTLTEAQVAKTCDILKRIMSEATEA
jgi:dTDP-4-amino-4,6-dideoxygalactose transaminase